MSVARDVDSLKLCTPGHDDTVYAIYCDQWGHEPTVTLRLRHQPRTKYLATMTLTQWRQLVAGVDSVVRTVDRKASLMRPVIGDT